ncbi:hypothetical protein N7501_006792 [Penicillium viridicatum]|nr:hypothetical protein N7501_006792 [Penicillium viridicatum]
MSFLVRGRGQKNQFPGYDATLEGFESRENRLRDESAYGQRCLEKEDRTTYTLATDGDLFGFSRMTKEGQDIIILDASDIHSRLKHNVGAEINTLNLIRLVMFRAIGSPAQAIYEGNCRDSFPDRGTTLMRNFDAELKEVLEGVDFEDYNDNQKCSGMQFGRQL